MLKGPYNVSVDTETVNTIESDLTNKSYLYITFAEGAHAVEIMGIDTVVPEFPPFLTMPLLITATLLMVTIRRRRH